MQRQPSRRPNAAHDSPTNELDDAFDASPIVLGDRMYLRGHDNLYCLGER